MKRHRRVRTWPTSTSGRSPRVTTRTVRAGGCAAIRPGPRIVRARPRARSRPAARPRAGAVRPGTSRRRGCVDPDRAGRAGPPVATGEALRRPGGDRPDDRRRRDGQRGQHRAGTDRGHLRAASVLAAAVHQARGALLLREGEAAEALTVLRAACRRWQDLDATHHAASTRLLLAEAYRSSATRTPPSSNSVPQRRCSRSSGPSQGRQRVSRLRGRGSQPAGMTDREVEVLRLVATGCTNRDVASMLFISDRTVHRHLSNIFMKIGVSSRSAATAYAFEHGIASRSG